ncbi:MAG: hypothetical protein KC589_10910 [Nanoarchaeota archaeon]|nr:hypothetical protein [Nanoarchaeota archaeon]
MTKKNIKKSLNDLFSIRRVLFVISVLILLIYSSTFLLLKPQDLDSVKINIYGNIQISDEWKTFCETNQTFCDEIKPIKIDLYKYSYRNLGSSKYYIKSSLINWNDNYGTYDLHFLTIIPDTYILKIYCGFSEPVYIDFNNKQTYNINLTLDKFCDSERRIYYLEIPNEINLLERENEKITSQLTISNLNESQRIIINKITKNALRYKSEGLDEKNDSLKIISLLKSHSYFLASQRAIKSFQLNNCLDEINTSLTSKEPLLYRIPFEIETEFLSLSNSFYGYSGFKKYTEEYLDRIEESDNLTIIEREIKSIDSDLIWVSESYDSCKDIANLLNEDLSKQDNFLTYKKFLIGLIFLSGLVLGLMGKTIKNMFISLGRLFNYDDKEEYHRELTIEDVKTLLSLNSIIAVILAFATFSVDKLFTNSPISVLISATAFISFMCMITGAIFGIKYLKSDDELSANRCWKFTMFGLTLFVLYIALIFIASIIVDFVKEIFINKIPPKP